MEGNVGPQQSSLTRGNFCEWHTRWNYKMLMWGVLVFLSNFCGIVLVHVPCVLPLCDLSYKLYGKRL